MTKKHLFVAVVAAAVIVVVGNQSYASPGWGGLGHRKCLNLAL